MSDWLLTNEEIGRAHGYPDGNHLRRIAEAQDAKTRRKLVEWVEEHSYQQFRGDMDLHLNYLEWQSLCEEVGLEVKDERSKSYKG